MSDCIPAHHRILFLLPISIVFSHTFQTTTDPFSKGIKRKVLVLLLLRTHTRRTSQVIKNVERRRQTVVLIVHVPLYTELRPESDESNAYDAPRQVLYNTNCYLKASFSRILGTRQQCLQSSYLFCLLISFQLPLILSSLSFLPDFSITLLHFLTVVSAFHSPHPQLLHFELRQKSLACFSASALHQVKLN